MLRLPGRLQELWSVLYRCHSRASIPRERPLVRESLERYLETFLSNQLKSRSVLHRRARRFHQRRTLELLRGPIVDQSFDVGLSPFLFPWAPTLGPNYLRTLLRLVAVSDNLLRSILSKNANTLGGFVKNQDSILSKLKGLLK